MTRLPQVISPVRGKCLVLEAAESGRIAGVAISALIMAMLNSGLIALGVNSAWQSAVTGVFMALFIGFSTNQQRMIDYFADKKRAKAAKEALNA